MKGKNKEGKYSCANGSRLQRSDHLLVNPNSEEGWSSPYQAPYGAAILLKCYICDRAKGYKTKRNTHEGARTPDHQVTNSAEVNFVRA